MTGSGRQVGVLFDGGLGNQMFQWALVRWLESQGFVAECHLWRYDTPGSAPLQLEMLFPSIRMSRRSDAIHRHLWKARSLLRSSSFRPAKLLEPFVGTLVSGRERQLLARHTLLHENALLPRFDNVPTPVDGALYIGYWQLHKLAEQVAEQLRADFRFAPEERPWYNAWFADLSSTESVGVHVRLGDYLSEQTEPLYGGICTKDYYHAAIRYFAQNPATRFYVFSNDPGAARALLPKDMGTRLRFVSDRTESTAHEEFMLLSACKNQIVANSTFSWWAAWLNSNQQKKVVTPARWMNPLPTRGIGAWDEVVPEAWVRMEA